MAAELDTLKESEIGRRYPNVIRSWRAKLDLMIPVLVFSAPIRKVLYTTNAIELLNSSVRRGGESARAFHGRVRGQQINLPDPVRSDA